MDGRHGWIRRYAQRLRPVARLLGIQLVLWLVLRVVLYARFAEPAVDAGQFGRVLIVGTLFDLLTALTALLPLISVVSIFGGSLRRRPLFRHAVLSVGFFLLTFDLFVQFFFFEEYSARYNHLALDYLMYPDEVLGNIFASYNVPLYVAAALVLAAVLIRGSGLGQSRTLPPWGWRDRLSGIGVSACLASSLWIAWSVAPFSVGPSRVAGEVALNGWAQLVRAYMTSHLDYEAYYASVPPQDAANRLSRLLDPPARAGVLARHFVPRGRAADRPLDVVIIMEESLGSNFSARFSGETEEPVTPALDEWSREGLALTNLVANGNRTVRGMEGILCSFPPLPGDSIVKRDRSENVASVARILSAKGYETTFFTGGYGLFDNVKAFMTANGFREFVEQPDYPGDAFRTVWGVADEFVFDAMIQRQKRARAAGRRWFGAAITVSNHKPFDVPAGRVTWPSGRSARRGAVRYADWALGQYLTRARDEHLLDDTVLLVVGDHGARVYGAEEIPVTSYRIPAIFLSPNPAYRGAVIDRLASQVDLAPTLLSLAGVEYDAPFFGRDLLGLPDQGGRAFVNHNRSIGLLTDSALVVLGLHKNRTFYVRRDRKSDTFTRVGPEDDAQGADGLRDLAADAAAVFQTAYTVYRERRFTLPK